MFVKLLEKAGMVEVLKSMDEVIQFMVGKSDNLTVFAFQRILEKARLHTLSQLASKRAMVALLRVLAKTQAGRQSITVFTFDNIFIGEGVTIEATGRNPMALLSQGDATIRSTIPGVSCCGEMLMETRSSPRPCSSHRMRSRSQTAGTVGGEGIPKRTVSSAGRSSTSSRRSSGWPRATSSASTFFWSAPPTW